MPRNALRDDGWMGNLWRRIDDLQVRGKGRTLQIKRGPSLYELEHCIFVPHIQNQAPVTFFLMNNGEFFPSISLRITLVYRPVEHQDTWQFVGVIDQRYRSGDPRKRPTLDEATVFVSHYNPELRTGFMQVPLYVWKWAREEETASA